MARRVLVCKLGLDGHDRGLRLIARQLRDDGAEVIYLGVGTTASIAASVAVEEDVSVVAVSILSGAHVQLVSDLMDELHRTGAQVPVVVGGLIPEDDVAKLQSLGVADCCSVGTSVRQASRAILDSARDAQANGEVQV